MKKCVALGSAAENKEFMKAFSVSNNQISLLMRDKHNTPTKDGGCATLSVAQSSIASKYSVASEHNSKNDQSSANTVKTANFNSRTQRDEQNMMTPTKNISETNPDSSRSSAGGFGGFFEQLGAGI